MAFSLKRPSTFEDYDHICGSDPAVDQKSEKFDYEKYQETNDLLFLPLREGHQPTVFRLRHLSGALHQDADDAFRSTDGMNRRTEELCRRAIVEIRNPDGAIELEKDNAGIMTKAQFDRLWDSPEPDGSYPIRVALAEVASRVLREDIFPKKKATTSKDSV